MGEEFLKFGDAEIEKKFFYHYKSLISSEYVDIENVLVFFGEKTRNTLLVT